MSVSFWAQIGGFPRSAFTPLSGAERTCRTHKCSGLGRHAAAQCELLELCRVSARSHGKPARDNGFHGQEEEIQQETDRARAGQTAGPPVLAHRARLLVLRKELEGRLADDRLPDRAGDRAAHFPVPAQPLEQGHLRRAGEEGQRDRPAPGDDLRPARGGQHRGCGLRGLRTHAHAAALARLAHRAHDDALAREGALLPAQSDRRRTQEPRGAHRGRHPHRNRAAGRFRSRHPERSAHLCDVHGRAVVGRRQPDRALWRSRHHHSRLSGHRGADLLRHHQRADDGDRAQFRADRRNEEPDRGGIPRLPHARTRIRGEHRDPRRREGRARGPRQAAQQGHRHLGEDGRAIHAHDVRLARQLRHRLGDPGDPVCAEISRGRDERSAP